MGSASVKDGVEKLEEDTLGAPSGFASLTIALRRAKDKVSSVAAESPCDTEVSSAANSSVSDGIATIRRSLKLESRPWIVYDQLQSEHESDAKQLNMVFSPKDCLRKGVIRGCSKCRGCQQVSARWVPDSACSYLIEDSPVFHPTHEEFKDILKFVDSIRQQLEPYGFCRIIPPTSWKTSGFFEEDDVWHSFKFNTRIQRLNQLQSHCFSSKLSADDDVRETKRRKVDDECSDVCAANTCSVECHGKESFQLESGPEFTLIAFKRYADYFKQCYFSNNSEVEQNIEGEYWRIVEKPTEEIEVLYGTENLSGKFPLPSNGVQESASVERSDLEWDPYRISGLPGSLLSFETSDRSDILEPQLQIGMCFSSNPWAVEEHHLYKLQYLHMGASRVWYGIPGGFAHDFENATKKRFPDISEERTQLLCKLGRQLSPGTLKSECIPVFRCIQRPGEFVLFLPGVYHSGFDCGFSCSTSAVFAPVDWLPHGLNSTELYRERKWRTLISYDRLLLRAANEALKARWVDLLRREKTSRTMTWKKVTGKDGMLTKALRARIRSEARCREYISPASQSRKMDKYFDAGGQKRECSTCYYDLYLSAATCLCRPKKYSCLVHAKRLCSCSWTDKVFLFRYQISELNILAESLEGKITAMRIWLRENLGSALQLDRHNESQNGHPLDSSLVTDISGGRDPSSEDDQASGSEPPSQATEPLSEDFSRDNLKDKPSELILNDSSDDESSSDLDIDALIAELESRKAIIASKDRNNEAASNMAPDEHPEKSLSLNHYLSDPCDM